MSESQTPNLGIKHTLYIFNLKFVLQKNEKGYKGYFSEINSDYVFVPLNYLPSLNGLNSYQIYFLEDSVEEAMNYSHKINRIRAKSIDLSLMEDLANQITVANSWISQQPNIDLIRI